MPQMAPINWLFLYILFTLVFIISIILIYFMFIYMPGHSKTPKLKSLPTWKW